MLLLILSTALPQGWEAAIQSREVPRTDETRDGRPDADAEQETIHSLQKFGADVNQDTAGNGGVRLPLWAIRATLAQTEVEGVPCLKSTEPQHAERAH